MSLLFLPNTTSVMNVLTQSAISHSQAQTQYRFQLIQNQLQNQYKQKIAAAQSQTQKSGLQSYLQGQIIGLTKQKGLYNAARTSFGTNANILNDLSTQFTSLQNAATAGDSAAFDGALSTAQQDLSYLRIVPGNPAFVNDGVQSFQNNGLGIGASSSYDLTTDAGRAAAIADINTAQNTANNVAAATTSNQIVAGSKAQVLDLQISGLTSQLQQLQLDSVTAVTKTVAQLQSKLATQLHLIQLNLASSQQYGASLQAQQAAGQAALDPPVPGTIFSLFA